MLAIFSSDLVRMASILSLISSFPTQISWIVPRDPTKIDIVTLIQLSFFQTLKQGPGICPTFCLIFDLLAQ